MTDTFDPALCTCSTVTTLKAALEQTELPLCEVHQADEVRARAVAAAQSKHRGHSEALQDTVDRITSKGTLLDELTQRRKAKDAREAAIANIADPLERSLVLLTNADLPLGLPPSAYSALAGFHDGDDAA